MYIVIVASKVSSGREINLCQELDVEPEHYEIQIKNPDGRVEIKARAENIVDALVFHSQSVEESVMTR